MAHSLGVTGAERPRVATERSPTAGSGNMEPMVRRRTTVELDEQLLNAADAEAKRTGRSEDEVIEDALRRHFEGRRPSVVDEVWARNAGDALSEDEALTLARRELLAMRRERGAGDKAAS